MGLETKVKDETGSKCRIKNTILLIMSAYEFHVFFRKTATLPVNSYFLFYLLCCPCRMLLHVLHFHNNIF